MDDQPHILYVEDDPMSCKIMQILLQNRLKIAHVTIFENSEDFEARVKVPRSEANAHLSGYSYEALHRV